MEGRRRALIHISRSVSCAKTRAMTFTGPNMLTDESWCLTLPTVSSKVDQIDHTKPKFGRKRVRESESQRDRESERGREREKNEKNTENQKNKKRMVIGWLVLNNCTYRTEEESWRFQFGLVAPSSHWDLLLFIQVTYWRAVSLHLHFTDPLYIYFFSQFSPLKNKKIVFSFSYIILLINVYRFYFYENLYLWFVLNDWSLDFEIKRWNKCFVTYYAVVSVYMFRLKGEISFKRILWR